MEIYDNYQNISLLHQKLSQKKSELAALDKEDFEKSTFEKNDTVSLSEQNYDENDYARVIEKFKSKDSEVKAHEQIHASNPNAIGVASYNYQMGPDGKLYAVGGSVRFDTSIPNDPNSARVKLEQLANGANSSGDLSGADASIAQNANLNKMLIQSIKDGYYEN